MHSSYINTAPYQSPLILMYVNPRHEQHQEQYDKRETNVFSSFRRL